MRLAGEEPHEVVRVADARSLAEGYGRGIAQSRGDVLVLSHDDVEVISDDLPGRLRRHLGAFDLVGVAGTTRLAGPSWLSAGPPYIYGQIVHPVPPRLGAPPEFSVDVYGAPAPVVVCVGAEPQLDVVLRRRTLVRARVAPSEGLQAPITSQQPGVAAGTTGAVEPRG